MTTNRLARSEAPTKRSAKEWADRGNRVLRGEEPNTKGEYEVPRYDVRWSVRDGRCVIEMVR